MSMNDAKDQLKDNMANHATALGNPALFNISGALLNICDELEQMRRESSQLSQQVTDLRSRLPR